MLITRFGHAAVLIEVADCRILIDPGVFSAPETFALTGLDAVVVTHQHPDHIDPDRIDGLVAANPDAVFLADPTTAGARGGPWRPHDGELTIGEVRLRGVGTTHAEILPTLPRVDNVGVVVEADGEPTFFHPGDSYATVPDGVDVLALPLSAPWTKVSETVAFVQAVAPRVAFPVHDATVAERAYGIYWGHVEAHGNVPDLRRLDQTASSLVVSHMRDTLGG